jgi:hypothetical protein
MPVINKDTKDTFLHCLFKHRQLGPLLCSDSELLISENINILYQWFSIRELHVASDGFYLTHVHLCKFNEL